MNARNLGLTQADAAFVAEFSQRSAQRIESGTHQPQRAQPHNQRASTDPLATVWDSELEPMLRREPKLKPMTLFEYLQDRYPGQYAQVLRTLQRRVQAWKALHGPSPAVMFELRHEAGRLGLSDFTELKGITITIAGVPFEHLLYHYRLAYSGWQYAQIIQGGESFIALCEGLQNALFACGGVPQQHRTDSLSAAYRNLGGKRDKPVTRLYEQLCNQYRMQPTRNNTSVAHENGSIECSHGHLKNRIEQALLLRGSTDFASIAEYQALIDAAVARLNAQCQAKFEQEKAALNSLPAYRVADYELLNVRVSCHSTIEVRCVRYSVPSRLIGRQLQVRLHHDRIVGYLGKQVVVELPRIRVKDSSKRRARSINYRHVIEGLRRKPRAFLYCTWQQDLLPNDHYCQLWQQLKAQFDLDAAAVVMVEALYIAATQDKEASVAAYLETQLQAQTLTLVNLKTHFPLPSLAPLPQLSVTQHSLCDYDQLLPTPDPDATPDQPVPKSEPVSQATPSVPHAQAVGKSRTAGDAGGLVLRSILAGTVRIGSTAPLECSPATRTRRSAIAKRKNGFQL